MVSARLSQKEVIVPHSDGSWKATWALFLFQPQNSGWGLRTRFRRTHSCGRAQPLQPPQSLGTHSWGSVPPSSMDCATCPSGHLSAPKRWFSGTLYPTKLSHQTLSNRIKQQTKAGHTHINIWVLTSFFLPITHYIYSASTTYLPFIAILIAGDTIPNLMGLRVWWRLRRVKMN